MTGFSVDLNRLNNVAKTDIPDIITGLNTAQASLNTAQTDQDTAYQWVTEGVSEDARWLTNDLLYGLAQLVQNLVEAKDAIHAIANRYAAADGQPTYPPV